MGSIYKLHKQKNNAQVDNAKDIDTAIPMYNLREYYDNYSKNIQKFVATL